MSVKMILTLLDMPQVQQFNSVKISLMVMQIMDLHWYDLRVITAPDGSFSAHLDEGQSYSLFVPSLRRTGSLGRELRYEMVNLPGVMAGTELEIALRLQDD